MEQQEWRVDRLLWGGKDQEVDRNDKREMGEEKRKSQFNYRVGQPGQVIVHVSTLWVSKQERTGRRRKKKKKVQYQQPVTKLKLSNKWQGNEETKSS